MKIAEFLVSIGFNIQGGQQLTQVNRGLEHADRAAIRLLAGVLAVNTALGAMIYAATSAGMAMLQFNRITDLSSQELKQWQYNANRNGIEAKQLTTTIEALQQAQADIALGRGNVAPFQWFGLDTQTSPFQMLAKIHDFVKDLNGIQLQAARTMASELGISNEMFAMLRQSDAEFTKLQRDFLLTDKNVQQLKTLSQAWEDLSFKIRSVSDRLIAVIAPLLTPAVRVLTILTEWMSRFVSWLDRGTPAAWAMRAALAAVVYVLGALAIGLSVIVTLLGALKIAALAADIALAPIAVTVGVFAAGLIVLAGILAGVILLVQDFWASMEGGKHVFAWTFLTAGANALASAIEDIGDAWDRLMGKLTIRPPGWLGKLINGLVDRVGQNTKLWAGDISHEEDVAQREDRVTKKDAWTGDTGHEKDLVQREDRAPKKSAWTGDIGHEIGLAQREDRRTRAANVTQHNNVKIQVDGSGDPVTAGQEAGRTVKREINTASRQLGGWAGSGGY